MGMLSHISLHLSLSDCSEYDKKQVARKKELYEEMQTIFTHPIAIIWEKKPLGSSAIISLNGTSYSSSWGKLTKEKIHLESYLQQKQKSRATITIQYVNTTLCQKIKNQQQWDTLSKRSFVACTNMHVISKALKINKIDLPFPINLHADASLRYLQHLNDKKLSEQSSNSSTKFLDVSVLQEAAHYSLLAALNCALPVIALGKPSIVIGYAATAAMIGLHHRAFNQLQEVNHACAKEGEAEETKLMQRHITIAGTKLLIRNAAITGLITAGSLLADQRMAIGIGSAIGFMAAMSSLKGASKEAGAIETAAGVGIAFSCLTIHTMSKSITAITMIAAALIHAKVKPTLPITKKTIITFNSAAMLAAAIPMIISTKTALAAPLTQIGISTIQTALTAAGGIFTGVIEAMPAMPITRAPLYSMMGIFLRQSCPSAMIRTNVLWVATKMPKDPLSTIATAIAGLPFLGASVGIGTAMTVTGRLATKVNNLTTAFEDITTAIRTAVIITGTTIILAKIAMTAYKQGFSPGNFFK